MTNTNGALDGAPFVFRAPDAGLIAPVAGKEVPEGVPQPAPMALPTSSRASSRIRSRCFSSLKLSA